jgi:hypothetical protein
MRKSLRYAASVTAMAVMGAASALGGPATAMAPREAAPGFSYEMTSYPTDIVTNCGGLAVYGSWSKGTETISVVPAMAPGTATKDEQVKGGVIADIEGRSGSKEYKGAGPRVRRCSIQCRKFRGNSSRCTSRWQ